MEQPEIIEILMHGISYVAIGHYADNTDGISFYFPEGLDGYSWLKKFEDEEPAISLLLIGNLYHYFDDSRNFFEEIFGCDLFNLFNQKKYEFTTFVSKYFEDVSVLMVDSRNFEDFIYGSYSKNNDNNIPLNWDPDPDSDIKGAEIGEDIFFKDGTVIQFINKEHSWDDLDYQIMIKKECYTAFMGDLNNIISLFRSAFYNDKLNPESNN